MGSIIRSLAITAIALATTTLPATRATAQLVVEAELREACEVLRLGDALDVPEWLAFSRTPSIKLDPSGRLFLKGQDPQVTVLEPDGSFVRYIGGEGEGPGEFTFFLTHDERVWLRDAVTPEDYEALWLVLGPDGEPEFRVHAPAGIGFRDALRDRVWGVGRTEMDVPFIVQYALVVPGEWEQGARDPFSARGPGPHRTRKSTTSGR